MKSLRKSHLSIAVAAALSTSLTSGIVLAQENTDDEVLTTEEVLVTGSRIATVDGFGATSPVTVVNSEEIANLGFVNIEQVMNSLPSIETSQNANISNGSSGTATIDLRGLGTNRTLVLINGRRMQSGGAQIIAPDVGQIPTIALDRVDVLTGGASATYGGDAVAGVVNFVTRKMDGIEIRAGWSGHRHENDNGYIQSALDSRNFDYPSGTEGPDGENYQIDFIMGSDFADGKGNATIYGTWREQKELRQEARDYSAGALTGSATGVGGSANAIIPNYFIAPTVVGGQGPAGTNGRAYDYGQEFFGNITPDGGLEPWDGTNRYNYAPVNHFLRPIEQWSVGAFAEYQLNEHFTPYFETMFASNTSRAQIAESGTFFVEAYILDLDDFPEPFQAALVDEFGAGYDEFGVYVGKRNVEGGPRSDNTSHDAFRIVTGLKGDINDSWSYDVSYLYANTRSTSTYVNDFFAPKITKNIDPDTADILYDVFTYQGVTPEQAAGLGGVGILNGNTSTEVLQGFVTGDLFSLPTASEPIKVVVGYEWREENFERLADTVFEEGQLLGQGGPTPSLVGGYNVTEFFGEANVPLLDSLALDLAYRYSDYSTVGGQDTYRLGLDWQPVDLARFRVGFNRAVRAPNVSELYTVQNLGLWAGVDPCGGIIATGESPEYTAAQCANTGVTAAQYGNISLSPADQYNQITGGNPDLQAEEADTITLGVVLTPTDDLSISVDYWSIEIEETITGIGAENIVRQCAENGLFCDAITRSGSGSLWQGETGYVVNADLNGGKNTWEGVDVAGNWTKDALGGTFDVRLVGTYMLTKETEIPAADTYDCTGIISSRCYAAPEWRHTITASYDSNNFWAVTARWRYFGGIDYDGGLTNGKSEGVDTIVQGEVDSGESYLDVNASFRILDNTEILVGINNVLDEEPPLVGGSLSSNANAVAGFYDTLGQYLFAQATFRF
jgi:outer membrane receptor protein involved in Fe transport